MASGTNTPDAHHSICTSARGERSALEAVLWRRQPELVRVRPALPGAALTDVRLLADGELVLSIAVPPGHQMQALRRHRY